MKAGNLSVLVETILGTGAFADPLPNDKALQTPCDAILLNGRDAYTGDITVKHHWRHYHQHECLRPARIQSPRSSIEDFFGRDQRRYIHLVVLERKQ